MIIQKKKYMENSMSIIPTKRSIHFHIFGRFFVLIILSFLLLFSGGCERKAEKEKLHLKRNSYKVDNVAKEVADEIISAAKDKDRQAIKELFSEYAVNINSEIDSQIEKFFNYCDYTTSDIEVFTNIKESGDPQNNYHYLFITVECSFMDSDGEKYRLYFDWIADDTEDESKIGINSIYIIKETNFIKKRNENWEVDIPGIYVIE